MRVFVLITMAVSAIAIVYRWRYRLINAVLTISFLRKSITSVMMRIPAVRKKIMSNLFTNT